MVRHWLLAARPKTLPVAIAPVLVGTTLAWAETGQANATVTLVILLAATLIQIATNLHNDVADHERGGDLPETRLGPPRATAEGWLQPARVRAAASLTFAAAGALGVWLIHEGGWPIALIGCLSIAAGWAYSGGPRPISYTSLGELFVWLFFGVIAVGGTYFLQTGTLTSGAVIAGAALGMPAAAVLVVNNYRDLENDRLVGRCTFAVRFGRAASRAQYALLMLAPFVLLPLLESVRPGWWLLPVAGLPFAVQLVARFARTPPGPAFNSLLAATARFHLVFGVLLCLALVAAAGRFS
jgi:1,4-dihydroxy-2-naphthoate octaprenyltransferase